jgi:hypothetical protein
MGTKDLFENPQGNKVLSSEDFDKEVQKVESLENLQAKFVEKRRFIPNVDFNEPKNFARYGLAKDYYVDSVDRIIREYPYDGSLKERAIFLNSSSYLDLYVLEERYPRTTGYVKLSAGGWGDLDGSLVGEYGKPEDVEYIQILGGPHTASGGMESGSLYQAFSGSNVYDTDIYGTEGILAGTRLGTRESNLQFNATNGCTIEFWLRKYGYAGAAKTKKEVIFDLWNQHDTGSQDGEPSGAPYGRLTLELSASNQGSRGLASNVHDGATFFLTLQSGSSIYGFQNESIANNNITTASVANRNWHHYAVTIASSSGDTNGTAIKFYVDGKLNQTTYTGSNGVGNITGSLIANIGALVATPSGSVYNAQAATALLGYGKLSASLDEFRYWKVARTDEQILNNYKYQVGGGTNTDISNAELGVYYKFNEGITKTSSVDSTILDYSGRISNGVWTGYVDSTSRNTGSAMVSASVVAKEYHDPIVYATHPDVTQLRSDLEATGSLYDYQNNSSLYHSLPDWITDDDQTKGSEHLKKLTQILASHFDALHLQIEALTGLKDVSYLSSSLKPAKPIPFADHLLTSKGFVAPEIFADADLVAQVLSRDEEREFELDLNDVKNFIYKNVYNNLTGLYKSKGTEKAFRNLIRCYGIGDEIVKLKAYANNALYALEDTHYVTAVPKKTINFNDPDQHTATVFQNSGSTDEQRATVISSSLALPLVANGYGYEYDMPFTVECEVIFPKKLSTTDEEYWPCDFVSSSVCGWHTALDSTVRSESFTTFKSQDYNLQLYAVKPEAESPDAYFVLTGSDGEIGISIETETYKDVYNNEKWNFAIRTRRDKKLAAGRVTGSAVDDNSILTPTPPVQNTVVELLGFNYDGELLQNSFHLSGNTNLTGAIDLFNEENKRFYVGADRTGFSGSVITKSDVKISGLKYWQSFVSDQALDIHARDAHNYGTLNPYRNAFLNETFAEGNEIPHIETLALHWDFSNITGSDNDGRFAVSDVSSGSTELSNRYSSLGKITKAQHMGLGYGFKTGLANSTASVSVEYINTAKQRLPEVVNSSDAVRVLMSDDDEFTKSSAVSQFFYAFEKSMYDTISQEIMNMFGTIAEFNNLIGEPVYRYRHEYKAMNKLRTLFFEKIGNTPNLDKYIDYYKWIDESLSTMLRRLAPISADLDPNVRTIIESHILERNKYQHKYPFIDTRGNRRFGIEEIEGTAKGIGELTYDWKHGHRPVLDVATEGSKATATITVADGDAVSGMTEKEHITITSLDGTTKRYVITDADKDGSTATGTVLSDSANTDTGAGTAGAAEDGGVAVSIDLTGTAVTQNAFLVQLKAAIEHANGHNGKITVSAVPDQADDEQSITLTQSLAGDAGNTAITTTISQITEADFTGGTDSTKLGNETDNALWWKERAARDEAAPDNAGSLTQYTARSSGDNIDINREKGKFRKLISQYDFRSGHRLTQTNIDDKPLIYTGSTYAVNRFAKPYKLSADLKGSPPRDIGGGYNFNRSKRFDFVRTALAGRFGEQSNIASSFHVKTLEQEIDVNDVADPNKKKKAVYSITFGDSPTTGHITTENKLYARIGAPFALVSSSLSTGYQKSTFHLGYNLAGLHTDGVVAGAIQGPFTEQHVGGLQYRHTDLNTSGAATVQATTMAFALNGLDTPFERAEPYLLAPGTSDIEIKQVPTNQARSTYYRFPAAKRPVNIANIRQTTDQRTSNGTTKIVSGTLNARLGNFSRTNQVVFVGDRGTNNQSFVRQASRDNAAHTGSSAVHFLTHYPKMVRDVAEHTIVERFSAPGSPETAGDSQGGPGLDYVSGQYSPYNNINYRNLGVRVPLRTLLTGVTGQFGLKSGIGDQTNSHIYAGVANYHKVHRNGGKRLEVTNEFTVPPDRGAPGGAAIVATASYFDNFFVSRPIPQTDLAYSWITSSYLSSHVLGYFPADGLSRTPHEVAAQNAPLHESTVSFVSQSFVGSRNGDSTSGRHPTPVTNNESDSHFTPTLFGTMNTNIIDPVNTSSAILGNPHDPAQPHFHLKYWNIGPQGSLTFEDGERVDGDTRGSFFLSLGIGSDATNNAKLKLFGNATLLNQLNLFRNGPHGYPSWKQIRASENGVTRLLNKNSKFSIMVEAEDKTSDSALPNDDHTTAFAQSRVKRGTTQFFVEPVVSSRHTPLKYKFSYGTKNKRGKSINRNVIIKCTLGNSKTKFVNNKLNNLVDFHSNNRRITAYDDIKDFYLDGALQDSDSPINKLISLEYKENIYPAERNTGLGKIRTRNNYNNNFWRTNREDRTRGGTVNTNDYSDAYNYYHSMWPLDAGVEFVNTGTAVSPNDSNLEHARPGILQAGFKTQVYEYGKGGNQAMAALQPGPLYNRFHLLSTTSSVVAPTGMRIPETGSELGNQALSDGTYSATHTNYQFSGSWLTNNDGSGGPQAFPGHGPIDSATHLGSALWQAGDQAGRVITKDGVATFVNEPTEPFYDSYDEFSADIRPHSKGMSILPEFRISDHIEYYVKEKSEDFMADNPQFLNIPGASNNNLTPINSSGSNFYKIFSFTDFMKHFKVVKRDHEEIADPTEITLECTALKKFLPYKGFYPADRTIQIASQWSSSYGEYISPGGGGYDAFKDSAFVGAPSLGQRPLIQALFAPGILYNSIKAGIACDWPCVTGSTGNKRVSMPMPQVFGSPPAKRANARAWGTGSRGEKGWDYRVPFEALLEPEKYLTDISFCDMEVEFNSSLIQLSASWSGQGDNLYKMMMNNFLAETTRFFLKKKSMSRITSAEETKFKTAESGSTYSARLKIYRSMNQPRPLSGSWGDYPIPQDPQYEIVRHAANGTKGLGAITDLRETFTMYSRPSAFGPPVAGFNNKRQQGFMPDVFDSSQGYNPSFTPPYYHGEAWADILWDCKMDGKPTLDDIFSNAKVLNLRIDGEAAWSPGASGSNINEYTGYEYPMASGAVNAYSMQLVHSFNIFGKGVKPLSKRRRGRSASDSDEIEDADVWVIEPKWETPMYNFNNEYGIASERMLAGEDSRYNLIMPSASSGKATVPRGMWHQFGVMPTSSDVGIFMEIGDIPDNWVQNANSIYGLIQRDGVGIVDATSPVGNNAGLSPRNAPTLNGAKSLVDLCGFRTAPVRMGSTANRRKISEAVVAIPFFIENGEMKYFDIDSETIEQAQLNIEQEVKGSELESVEDMLRKIDKFILPPKFDFVKNVDVTPISMYIFEFSHMLNQNDLSHMWQNLPPKIGKKTMKAQSSIKHRLLSSALMGSSILDSGERMKDKVQWMVFKVKQRAESDYFKVTANTTPRHFIKTTGVETAASDAGTETRYEHQENPAIPSYSYNWPYDFFSLIEFAGISSEVTFETPEIEDKLNGPSDGIPLTVAREIFATESDSTQLEDEEEEVAPGGSLIETPMETSVLDSKWYEAEVDSGIFEDD